MKRQRPMICSLCRQDAGNALIPTFLRPRPLAAAILGRKPLVILCCAKCAERIGWA